MVDTMLQGLGKSLRHIGIDVVILDEKVDQERAVKVEQQSNSGLVFGTLHLTPSDLGLTP